jgi:putative aldouronate transport system substrate-binding protein
VNAISATAEDPESGLKFLNWLYANKDNFNLWHMGIEGVHWDRDDEYVTLTTDENGILLYWFETWMTGYIPYYSFARGTEQSVIDMWTKEAPNRVYSPMAGFIFDATPVASELASLQTEIIATFYPLKYGLVDWDTAYPRSLARLKDAGLDKYLAEYRRQFAEYIKINPDFLK